MSGTMVNILFTYAIPFTCTMCQRGRHYYLRKLKFWVNTLPQFIANHFLMCMNVCVLLGFLGGSMVKNLPANAGDMGLIPGLGRSPGGENGNPFQYSCLENSMDRGAWWGISHRVAKSWTWLSMHTCCVLLHTDLIPKKKKNIKYFTIWIRTKGKLIILPWFAGRWVLLELNI